MTTIHSELADAILKQHQRLEVNMTDVEKLVVLETIIGVKVDRLEHDGDGGDAWRTIIAANGFDASSEAAFAKFVRQEGFEPQTATLEDLDALASEFLSRDEVL